MYDILLKEFPELKNKPPYYIESMGGFTTKANDIHEPLDGFDVFVDNKLVGQIDRMPCSYEHYGAGYYRGFYLEPITKEKEKLVDGIYIKLEIALNNGV